MIQNILIINDCYDNNAKARQISRYASLFPGVNINLIGVDSNLNNSGSIEASGNLVDIIDSNLGSKSLIIVNIAPRSGKAKKWFNGTPFGYFKFNNNIVLSSLNDEALSLVKKLGLLKAFYLTDIPTVLEKAFENNLITQEEKQYIINTQFRSFEYLPRLAYWLVNKSFKIPNIVYNDFETKIFENIIWYIDNFGNCKTSILTKDFDEKKLTYKFKNLKFYEKLKDVPNGETAFISGSSGYKENRFIEIVIQGGNIAKVLDLKIGENIYLIN